MSSSADIAVTGGSAFSGKTFGLILEGTRYLSVPRYGATYFRRTKPQLFERGAGWDSAFPILSGLGGIPNYSEGTWYFDTGDGEFSTFGFRACQHDKSVLDFRTAQFPTLLIDEAVLFTENQIWGLWSRCRTEIPGVVPCMRLGTNPDPDHFLASFLSWWIDQETGYPLYERSGILRWFVRESESIHWGEPAELRRRFNMNPISVTFIPGLCDDNPIGRATDPAYVDRLNSLSLVDKERLLRGNWKIRVGSGLVRREWLTCNIRSDPPPDITLVRWWDTAGTDENEANAANAAWTCGVLMGVDEAGRYWLVDVRRVRLSGHERDMEILGTTRLDAARFGYVRTWFEQEPGGAGKTDARANVRLLAGFDAQFEPSTGDKVTRFKPFARQCEARNVYLVAGPWVEDALRELEVFPKSKFKDIADGCSGAFSKCAELSAPQGTGIYDVPNAPPSIASTVSPDAFQ